MTILVTGAAGFIGYHVCRALLARGDTVLGLDNLNAYYDPALKRARLDRLRLDGGFIFMEANVADRDRMRTVAERHPGITGVIHLAAQAGVRFSLVDPYAYVEANVMGHLVMLEMARHMPGLKHLVYASSSSVYGGNTKVPFAVGDPVEQPRSLYAATKRADELMAETYAHLFGLRLSGLRFFTVYGPWGRPDMAPYIFCRSIFAGETLPIYNLGFAKRDFSYVDDIVRGVLACLDRPAAQPGHRVYNLGGHRSEELMRFVALLEGAIGRKARIALMPAQPGDMTETYADIDLTTRELGWTPLTTIDEGVPRFVHWFRQYHGL
ncbi:NAD-dependent epimerase/dehydratase family protein [Vineibacter terrae]|uniref:NAD-dependent epimerase/dehydratase family protein n=1 Tax=Vineibacter terrae TaxID=2586908 RepID=UPI002E34E202|nr:NAD-dependent epimerase/dehydratase family protein [Vineibacter terrae]HEX2886585.1 NAD-dependent epimerase/dehydratase family protein [Vineibacter terrae]